MEGDKIPLRLFSWLLTSIVWLVMGELDFYKCAARLRRVSHGSWGIRSTSHTTLLSLGGNRKGRCLFTRHETYLLERSNVLKLVQFVLSICLWSEINACCLNSMFLVFFRPQRNPYSRFFRLWSESKQFSQTMNKKSHKKCKCHMGCCEYTVRNQSKYTFFPVLYNGIGLLFRL